MAPDDLNNQIDARDAFRSAELIKTIPRRAFMTVTVLGGFALVRGMTSPPANGDDGIKQNQSIDDIAAIVIDARRQTRLVNALAQPFVGTIVGQPIRNAIATLAESVSLPFWFDPHLNPSKPIDHPPPDGRDGPAVRQSIGDAFATMLQRVGGVWFAAEDIVIMAPRNRIAKRAAAFLSPIVPDAERRQRITWPMLTTPTEALRGVTNRTTTRTATSAELPHDLLPAVSIRDVHPTRVASLIRSIYLVDRGAKSSSQIDPMFSLDYPSGRVTGNIGDHIEPTRRWVNQIFEASAKNRPDDRTRYSLTTRAPAETILRSLAQAAGKSLDMQQIAPERRNTPVTLDAVNQTIEQLVQTVAKEIDATVESNGDSLTLRPR